MMLNTLAMIHFFRIRTIYFPLRMPAFLVLGTLVLFAGVLCGAGVIRGKTYVVILAALCALLVIIMLGTRGAHFYLRTFH